jgi:transposase
MQFIKAGLDLGKRRFHVHGMPASGPAYSRELRRGEVERFFAKVPACVIGMEACATAHYWARRLTALGHAVRLIPPAYVKPYVRRGKTDAADAAAICEALERPGLHCVPVKSESQQAALLAHRVRALLVEQRTRTTNALRAHLAEFGIVAPAGSQRIAALIEEAVSGEGSALPQEAQAALSLLAAQYRALEAQIAAAEKLILARHKSCPTSQRLARVPGVGPITATAIVAAVPDPALFASGRDFAAWLGLTPRLDGTGGRTRTGAITKAGDRYLRTLLVVGANAVIRRARQGDPRLAWFKGLLERKRVRVATVAQANKTARILWALLARGTDYRAPAPPQPAA